jgi:hypothetical protein
MIGKTKLKYETTDAKGEVSEYVNVMELNLPFCTYQRKIVKDVQQNKKAVEHHLDRKPVDEMICDGILLSVSSGIFASCCKGVASIINAFKNKKSD